MMEAKAPTGDTVVDYDRTHLALYAALLDAADAGRCWRDAATALMGIDIADPRAAACWRSHLDRARWIVGDGLGPALIAFRPEARPVGKGWASTCRSRWFA